MSNNNLQIFMKTLAPTLGLALLFWVVYLLVNKTGLVLLIFVPAFYALGMYILGLAKEEEDRPLYKGCITASVLFLVALLAFIGTVVAHSRA